MSIRIKPKIDLGPCVLTLKSIEDITQRVSAEFPHATFSASDYIWEIIDEPQKTFIQAISEREKLDEFIVSVKLRTETKSTNKKNGIEEIIINFNKDEATVSCKAHPDQQNWFEHFLIDLKRYLLPPTVSQRMAHIYRDGKWNLWDFIPGVGSFLSLSLDEFSRPTKNPYVRIVIKQKAPDPFVENIKANLASNIIWALLGAILLLIGQWVLRTYGIDINPFS